MKIGEFVCEKSDWFISFSDSLHIFGLGSRLGFLEETSRLVAIYLGFEVGEFDSYSPWFFNGCRVKRVIRELAFVLFDQLHRFPI